MSDQNEMQPSEFTKHCLRTWGDRPITDAHEAAVHVHMLAAASAETEAKKKKCFFGRNVPSTDKKEIQARTTAVLGSTASHGEAFSRIAHAFMGMGGELHEVLLAIGDQKQLKLELGDMLYYLTVLAHEHGLSLDEVMQRNVAKLKERYPEPELA